MFNSRRFATYWALGLLLVVGSACSDDPGTNSGDSKDRVTDPVDVPTNSELLHVEPDCSPGQRDCVYNMTVAAQRTVKAQLIDSDGHPVEDALVSFEANFGNSGMSISTMNAVTDSEGIAKATLTAGESPGTGELTAKTESPDVPPIKWMIGTSTKDAAAYNVSFEHSGTAQVGPITARLYPDSVTCESLESNPAQTAVLERTGSVDAAGDFPTIIFSDRPNGDSYTVAAWAYSLTHNGDVEVAYGCTAPNPTIEAGESVDVLVELVDHMPNIVGQFNVIHEFDLVGALPDNVQTVVNLIGRLANDPGSFVVGCPSGSTDPGCPAGSQGLLNLLADFLPDGNFKDAINGFLDSNIGNSVLRDAINAVAQSWLDRAPAWVGNTVNVTGDIVDTLTHFKVEGTMTFDEAPEVSFDADTGELIGVLPAKSGSQMWSDFVFRWRVGCSDAPDPEACASRRMGSTQLGIEAVSGEFDGALLGSSDLQINQHTLSLNYGAMLVAIIEKIVLPEIFGSECGPNENQACDSLDLALGRLISCSGLANRVTGNDSGATYDVVHNLCTNLLREGSQRLREYASTQLVASGEDVFLIGTPAGEHCTLVQPEVYQGDWPGKPYPYIQYLGRDEPAELQCKWDATIRFSADLTSTVQGKFWGERRQ